MLWKSFYSENSAMTHFRMIPEPYLVRVISHGTLMYIFQQKLKKFKQHLKDWNKTTFGNIFQEKQDLEQQMQNIQQEILTHGATKQLKEEETQIKQKLNERYVQEEMLWHQKSHTVA
jgi:hypothetical protein